MEHKSRPAELRPCAADRTTCINQRDTEDRELLGALRRGHHAALERLSVRYRSRIVRLAARYVRNLADAEDLAQDVLVKVWRNVSRFEGEPRLWPWIARITANSSISYLRSRKRRQVESLALANLPDGDLESFGPPDGLLLADDEATLAQFRERTAAALDRLPVTYRAAVVLIDLCQYSTVEASRSLGIPVPTVKSRAIRGRRLLRQSLAAFRGGLGLRMPHT
jgi:RNA polymerase sigma-70 factor (ECF subfamily)